MENLKSNLVLIETVPEAQTASPTQSEAAGEPQEPPRSPPLKKPFSVRQRKNLTGSLSRKRAARFLRKVWSIA